MNSPTHHMIDQALFGYSDGHRQIASSVRLPPKDLYLLSSATDLASGAFLADGESYLSGLPLPESKRYALFRTWAAPEMPRPGCVWSHVFMLDARTSSSVATVLPILRLFRRPTLAETAVYEQPLNVAIQQGDTQTSRTDIVSEVISEYYAGNQVTLSPEIGEPEDIEKAMLSVWSQQWPRLRSSFSFCSASLRENRRTDQSDYNVQVAPKESLVGNLPPDWAIFGAADAAKNSVTPLRRFLWRYGRDIVSPRRHYKLLVDLFQRFHSASFLPASSAAEVFRVLSTSSDGSVLKRDILGIGPSSPRLIPAVSASDFFKLLTSGTIPVEPDIDHVKQRLEELTSKEIGTVARCYGANRDALSAWKDIIFGSIVSLADKQSLTSEYPTDMVADVLLAREDLIDADTLSLVDNDVLPRLIKDETRASLAQTVMNEILRRDMGALGNLIVASRPEFVFQSAVEALCENRIKDSWLVVLAHHAGPILAGAWLSHLKSSKEFAAALSILR
ncbi:MAG: hypothetical protein JWL86_5327, partial [Rhizobium sp.]|nr:hypothetical protein [Rhizobium sp.]